jgi:HlyD family secretion protein
VKSSTADTVLKVLVSLGDKVTKGQPVISLTDNHNLDSPQDGSVTSILVSDGSVMWPGKVAARVTDLSQPDVVVAAVPINLTGTIVPGLPVRMEVSSAPPSKYGYLLGSVDEISQDPYTSAQLADRLDLDVQVVQTLLGTEPALLVIIRLEFDPSTPSGYRWSVGQGPPFVLTTGVPINARIVLSEQRPIDVVFS